MKTMRFQDGVEVIGEIAPGFEAILTPEALGFVAKLVRQFSPVRHEWLRRRDERQQKIHVGVMPDFLVETASVRKGDWTIAPVPSDLQDRRVEITGPVDRKMVINALNSGANVYMADFEDSHSPGWKATIQGQINLRDAVRGTIDYTSPEGKFYQVVPRPATLMVRPRGWHLVERHLLVDGEVVSASLFDFGLFFFHNARALMEKGSGPYFYLPKMESHLEARLWNDVFTWSEQTLDIPPGTIKATVLIETILAAFEMDEILYELREHSAGLNCGRWDYIFSVIKKFSRHARFMMPDRSQITMTAHFLRSYSKLLIQTCHRRKAHAMGGMAAQIPIKHDARANEEALNRVRLDKEREVGDGHDGTWVAHPALVPLAKEVFDGKMPGPHQLGKMLEEVRVTSQDLLTVPSGTVTEAGLRANLTIGVQYLEAWLSGTGCVPLYHLMEDAATAEISRAQVWQWIRHRAALADGRNITKELVISWMGEELAKIRSAVGAERYDSGRYVLAADIMNQLVVAEEFVPFLTVPAYEHLD